MLGLSAHNMISSLLHIVLGFPSTSSTSSALTLSRLTRFVTWCNAIKWRSCAHHDLSSRKLGVCLRPTLRYQSLPILILSRRQLEKLIVGRSLPQCAMEWVVDHDV
ncbi:hypothetical protein F4818DRAFT_433818, partial [Hypoxylon cercidicola]